MDEWPEIHQPTVALPFSCVKLHSNSHHKQLGSYVYMKLRANEAVPDTLRGTYVEKSLHRNDYGDT